MGCSLWPHARPRPSDEQLAALDIELGSTGRVADRVDIRTDTARRWLHPPEYNSAQPVVDLASSTWTKCDADESTVRP